MKEELFAGSQVWRGRMKQFSKDSPTEMQLLVSLLTGHSIGVGVGCVKNDLGIKFRKPDARKETTGKTERI